ncbi:MAG: vanadium-dependent haloperoxidase [Deltaproteobacteria bacterium]|nr:vanadium-dependent haloperoxidase [Deltaproteobacteria bacterium]
MSARFALCAALLPLLTACPKDDPQPAVCDMTAADWLAVDGAASSHSAARRWDELILHAIRKDVPRPTVHARNLFHLSAAMWDTWAAYDATAQGVFFSEKLVSGSAADVEAARAEAIQYAAHRVLTARYAKSAGAPAVLVCFDEGLTRAGFDPSLTDTAGSAPHAVGNRIGQAILDATHADGSNEANNYADTTGWTADNPSLDPSVAGITMANPDHWQQLLIGRQQTQNGINQPGGLQTYVGAQWGLVTPFAMTRPAPGALYHDPGPAPAEASDDMRDAWALEIIQKQSLMSVDASKTMDISPSALGNNSLGANDGHGHALNPVTNAAYPSAVVPVADFGRVIAEFWADGPNSETPPGHWNVLANLVADSPSFPRQLGGTGPSLPPLEWDVKVYLAVNGAVHDAAITAWEIKRKFTTARPISLVRYLSTTDARGLPVTPGVIRTANSGFECFCYVPGQGVAWTTAAAFQPYQKTTFVTPAFPGFISGHSTFSRAAAEVLADLTGSIFFPQGLASVTMQANKFLQFEQGPSVDLTLQWATYYDAADQAGQSRIWGGIHIQPDDFVGRKLGHDVGLAAAALARKYYAGTARP